MLSVYPNILTDSTKIALQIFPNIFLMKILDSHTILKMRASWYVGV